VSDWKTIDYFGDESLNETRTRTSRTCAPSARCCCSPTWLVAVTGYEEAARSTATPTPSRRATRWLGRSRRSGALEATTSARSSMLPRPAVPDERTHLRSMTHRAHTRAALLMRLITPKRAQGQRGVMWRKAINNSTNSSATAAASSSAPMRNPSPCLSSPTSSGCPRQIITVPRRVRPEHDAGRDRCRQPAREELNALGWLDGLFAQYIEDRRREPRNDVLTDLALHYPDGHARSDVVVGRPLPVRRWSGDTADFSRPR